MMLRPLFRRPKAETRAEKPAERISTAYATQSPDVITSMIAPTYPSSTRSTDSAPEEDWSDLPTEADRSDSDHLGSDDDGDSLDSFIAEYNNEFGRRMVEDAAQSSEIEDRVRQVLRQRPGLRFSADAVRCAAKLWDREMMMFLLETQGRKVHLTCGVIEAAVANERVGVEVMAVFQERGAATKITTQVVIAAYENKTCGRDILMQLLCDPNVSIGTRGAEMPVIARFFDAEVMRMLLGRSNVRITERALVAAARNLQGKQILEMLFIHRSEVEKVEDIAVAAAGNKIAGLEIFQFLLDSGLTIPAIEKVWQAAAGHEKHGSEIIGLLLDHQGEVLDSEEVIMAAARNTACGNQIISLLLNHQGKVLVSEKAIVAAAGNTAYGKEIIELLLEHNSKLVLTEAIILTLIENNCYATELIGIFLDKIKSTEPIVPSYKRHAIELIDMFLDKSTNEIQFTERIVPSFIKSSVDDSPWMEPMLKEMPWLSFAMRDAIFYILNGKHKDRVSFTVDALVGIMGGVTYEVICDLLDMLGERVSITEEMIEAVAETGASAHVAETVQRLFEHTPSVRVTDKAVILAATRSFGGEELLAAFFRHDSQIRVTPAAIEAATGNKYWAADIVKTLLEQTPTVQITEKAVAAAGHGMYKRSTFDIFVSKCSGEIRLSFQALPYMIYNITTAPTIDFVKRVLSEAHGATVIGPPMEEAVRLEDPEIVALMLKNGKKSGTLSIRAAEGAAGNRYAGKEIIQMLLDHDFKIEVTESVVRRAADIFDKGYEIMNLLLRDTERVRVSQSGVEAIATLLPLEIVRLLFETREDVTITTRMIEGAARNGRDVLDVLVETLGELPPITDGVLQAAASNVNTLRWIYSNYGDEVEITERAVEIAAKDSTAELQVMLEQWGDQIYITTKVMEAVATSYSVCDSVRMLFEMRPDEVYLSEDFWIAASGSEYSWRAAEAVNDLSQFCDCILITEDLVTALMKHHNRKDILNKLLRNNKARITTSGVQAIARSFDLETFTSMLDRHGHYINVTERIMEAAAENQGYGFEIVEFLIRTRDEPSPWCGERVIKTAARNPQAGRDIIELLLCEFPRSQFATEEVLIAAAENTDKSMGRNILELLLNQREDEAVVTTAVIDAAIANSLWESIISELREFLSG